MVDAWQQGEYPEQGFPPHCTGWTKEGGYTDWATNPYLREYEWDNTGKLHERHLHYFEAHYDPEQWSGSTYWEVDHNWITVEIPIGKQ